MRGLLHTSRYRGLAVVLLVCALAMRMLVPSGFMIAPGVHGATLVLCPGQGAMPAAMPHDMGAMAMPGHAMSKPSDKHPDDKHQEKGDNLPCAFSPVGATANLVSVAHPMPPVAVIAIAPTLFRIFVQPGLGLAAPPPPKTGPPALV
jgi:hypothetical protein